VVNNVKAAKGRLILLSQEKLRVLTHAEWDDVKEEALFGVRLGDELPGFRTPGPKRAAKIKALAEQAGEPDQARTPCLTAPARYSRRKQREPEDYEMYQPALPEEPAA